MVVIMRFPLRLGRVRIGVEIGPARAPRKLAEGDSVPPEIGESRHDHPQHDDQRPRDQRHDRRENWAVFHRSPRAWIAVWCGCLFRLAIESHFRPWLVRDWSKRRE